jgi:hypothetical protein
MNTITYFSESEEKELDKIVQEFIQTPEFIAKRKETVRILKNAKFPENFSLKPNIKNR